jgi:hypothetical protein
MLSKFKAMGSSATTKVSGMLKSSSGDNLHSVLQKQEKKSGSQRRRDRSDPFIDGPSMEEVGLAILLTALCYQRHHITEHTRTGMLIAAAYTTQSTCLDTYCHCELYLRP